MELRSDVNHEILRRVPRARIGSLLCCAGGGVPAAMFTLGAIQRQVETGEFYRHDVVSSASGSVVVCALIERCYDRGYVSRASPAWYTTHVVRPVHRLCGEGTRSGLWPERVVRRMVEEGRAPTSVDDVLRALSHVLLDDADDSRRPTRARRPVKPRFLYNYIDVDTGFVSNDHADLPMTDDMCLAKVIARCCLPASRFNGRAAADAGFKGNQYGTNVLYQYNPRRLTLITSKNAYQYARTPALSLWQILVTRTRPAFDLTSDIAAVLIADPDVTPRETIVCTISSGLSFRHPTPAIGGCFTITMDT